MERKEQANRESGGGKEGSAKRDRERSGARGQRGRIIRPQNPEAFNIIRYRVSSIGCRGRRERKRGRPGWRVKERPAERERERERERIEERVGEGGVAEDEAGWRGCWREEVEETDGAQEWRDTEGWPRVGDTLRLARKRR